MAPVQNLLKAESSQKSSENYNKNEVSSGCDGAASADYYKCDYRNNALSILVVGASGDLAAKKTYSALLSLFRDGYLPEHTVICGYARSKKKDEEFRKYLSGKLTPGGSEDETVSRFLERCIYRSGQYDDEHAVREIYQEISKMEAEARPDRPANRLFYFAVPPIVFPAMGRTLKAAAESDSGWNRYIVEKPFGQDTESFEELNKEMKSILAEKSIFRYVTKCYLEIGSFAFYIACIHMVEYNFLPNLSSFCNCLSG